MNPVFHRLHQISCTPTTFSTGEAPEHLFNLRLQYRPDGQWQSFVGVHIPKSLQHELLNGEISGMQMETLEVNSVSAMALPGHPTYAVVGLEDSEGRTVSAYPSAWKKARVSWNLLGGLICGAAVGAGLLGSAWLAMFLAVWGTHCLRTSATIPPVSFKSMAVQG